MNRGAYDRLVRFQRPTVTGENDYGEQVTAPELLQDAWARVRFGSAQEKREGAQESGTQSITLEVVPTSTLLGVKLTDQVLFDGSTWDVTEVAPLDRNNLRFTAVRSV